MFILTKVYIYTSINTIICIFSFLLNYVLSVMMRRAWRTLPPLKHAAHTYTDGVVSAGEGDGEVSQARGQQEGRHTLAGGRLFMLPRLPRFPLRAASFSFAAAAAASLPCVGEGQSQVSWVAFPAPRFCVSLVYSFPDCLHSGLGLP